MAVPLLDEERVLGVLQVLDRPAAARFSLQEMELLGLFANQAAIALTLLTTARRARAALAGDARGRVVAELAGGARPARGRPRGPADALLRSLATLRPALNRKRESPARRALSILQKPASPTRSPAMRLDVVAVVAAPRCSGPSEALCLDVVVGLALGSFVFARAGR